MLFRKRGFTLVELLVVISIIGFLSSIILSTVSAVRIKARNAQRISEMHEIINALEMYALDHNGSYPDNDNGTYNYDTPADPSGTPGFISTLIAGRYIGNVVDPNGLNFHNGNYLYFRHYPGYGGTDGNGVPHVWGCDNSRDVYMLAIIDTEGKELPEIGGCDTLHSIAKACTWGYCVDWLYMREAP